MHASKLMRIAMTGLALSVAIGACGSDEDATPSESELTTAAEEVLSDCLVPDEIVAEATGEEIDSSTDTSSGALPDESGEFAVNYSGCTYTVPGGGSFEVLELTDAGGFATIADQAGAEPLEGIGDEAVTFEDEILFKAGNEAYAVSGQDKDFQPLATADVEPLAKATVQEVAG